MKPRILVIRGGAIGDFILTLPAIALLRENFPEAHLEIIGYQHIVALAEGRFYADGTRSIEYGPMAAFFIPRSDLPAELSEYFAGFQQIVSWLYDPDGFFEANLRRAGAKNVLSAWRKPDDSDHVARQWARPLEALALYLEDAAPRLYPTAEDHTAAAALLAPAGEQPVIALHPGSGSPRKNWPIERWAQLGRRMAGEARLLVTGGEADEAGLAFLQEEWRDLPVLWARHLPLPVLAAAFRRCQQYFGHDSGISHLAAAAGAPCLLLFGPTDPDIWAPVNQSVQVMHAPHERLENLTVEQVLAARSAP